MERNLFVLGIDDFNLRQLRAIRNADNYRFHPLMTFDEVKAHGTFPFQSVYVYRGKAQVYGVVDSINYPNGMSFQRYQYPSQLPSAVKTRLREASVTVMEGIGYDQAAFNIEYFYDEDTDSLSLLEINPRISQSPGYLYEQVDGRPNHQIGVEFTAARDQQELLERYEQVVDALPLKLSRS